MINLKIYIFSHELSIVFLTDIFTPTNVKFITSWNITHTQTITLYRLLWKLVKYYFINMEMQCWLSSTCKSIYKDYLFILFLAKNAHYENAYTDFETVTSSSCSGATDICSWGIFKWCSQAAIFTLSVPKLTRLVL